MKKKIVTGILATALFLGVGTTAYVSYAKENNFDARGFMQQRGVNVEQAEQFMKDQGIDVNQMYQIMNSGNFDEMQKFMQNQNINFGQMLPYAKQMHPDLSTEQIQKLYESMHGTGGSPNSSNFQGMGNLN
ncbi:hypothetical protein [Tepidibacillus marianensis]|uniref:hypothetical protein n=1 Tax=Tepidibacillus marianensis TaxID=3131995 RepID=UPI0030CA9182